MQCITTGRYSVSSVPEWLITSVCQISFTHHDSNKISSSRYSSVTRHTQVPQGICPRLELSFRVIGLLFRVVVWVMMRIYGYTDCKQESWTLVGTTFVRNANIRCITNQPPLSSIIKSCRLTFFGHLAQMDENADASQATFKPPPENWRWQPGRPHTT